MFDDDEEEAMDSMLQHGAAEEMPVKPAERESPDKAIAGIKAAVAELQQLVAQL